MLTIRYATVTAQVRRFLGQFNLLGWNFVGFGVGGTLARVLDLGTGIVIIRSVPPESYASYGLMVATTPVFSMALTSGVLPTLWSYAARRDCTDSYIVAIRTSAATSLHRENRWFYYIFLFISLLLMMQVAQGFFQVVYGAFVIVALSVVGAHQAVNDAVLQLSHRQMTVVGGALIQSAVRLAALPLLSMHSQAINLMMAASTIAVLLNYAFCRRLLRSTVDSRPDAALANFGAEVRALRRRSIPTDIYQAVSGQFYYWALAFFAGPLAVAGFAAITRLGQLMFPLSLLFRGYFVPGFARLKNGASLQKYFFALLFSTTLITAPIVSIPLLWPEDVLKVLGPHYMHLTDALIIYSTGMLFWVAGDLADQLLRSRGLVQSPIWSVTLDSIAFLSPLILAGKVTVLLTFWSFLCIALVRLARIAAFALLSLRRGT